MFKIFEEVIIKKTKVSGKIFGIKPCVRLPFEPLLQRGFKYLVFKNGRYHWVKEDGLERLQKESK